MIFSIRGILGHYELGFVIVDINGISLRVFVPNSMMSKLPSVGEEVFLYTHFIVRQEELSLYGFLNAQDKLQQSPYLLFLICMSRDFFISEDLIEKLVPPQITHSIFYSKNELFLI